MAEAFADRFNATGGLPDPEADSQFYEGVPAKRLIAWLIDVAIVWGSAIVVSLLMLGLGFLIFGFILLVVDFLYRVTTIGNRSATWGMRVMGIELRQFSGERFNTGVGLIHTLLFYLSLIFVVVQLISVLMMAGSRFGRGLHDTPFGSTMINRPA